MTTRGKKSLRNAFFKALGPNTASFKAMFDAAPELCLNMKDLHGRFMALNRRNCEVSGIKDEWDVIGLTSADIFPAPYANAYMALDEEVRRTGRPILNRITEFPTDKSRNFMVSNLYPLFDRNGKLVGTAHVYTVTSERKAEGHRFRSMRDAADYIMSHLASNLTIAELSRLAHMSPSSFKKAFAATFDMPPGRYILTARINAARRLLETSSKLVSDIASECGFFDQSHFSKAFTRARGVTPGAYRRQHRGFRQAQRAGMK